MASREGQRWAGVEKARAGSSCFGRRVPVVVRRWWSYRHIGHAVGGGGRVVPQHRHNTGSVSTWHQGLHVGAVAFVKVVQHPVETGEAHVLARDRIQQLASAHRQP